VNDARTPQRDHDASPCDQKDITRVRRNKKTRPQRRTAYSQRDIFDRKRKEKNVVHKLVAVNNVQR